MVLLPGLLLCGCATRSVPSNAPNAGLTALAKSDAPVMVLPPPTQEMNASQKAAWARQAALNLEQVLKETEEAQDRPSAQAGQMTQSPTSALGIDTLPNSGLANLTVGTNVPERPSSPVASTSPTETMQPANEPASVSPLVELSRNMSSLLRHRNDAGKPLITDAAALTPLVAMQPDALATLDRAGDPKHPLHDLAEADRATLAQARERLLANPKDVPPDLLAALRANAALPDQIVITKAALCTRVEGFGRFDVYSSNTFVAGTPIRAVVYTQLVDFGTRPARDTDPVQKNVPLGEQVSVDLTQEISLFHDPDGLLAWHRPGQIVVETSRTKRSDFYLVQQIELPATVSIGRYNLKVTVIDRTSGAMAERVIPIEVVADARLVR